MSVEHKTCFIKMREASFQKIVDGMILLGLNVAVVKTKMSNLKSTYYGGGGRGIEKSKSFYNNTTTVHFISYFTA